MNDDKANSIAMDEFKLERLLTAAKPGRVEAAAKSSHCCGQSQHLHNLRLSSLCAITMELTQLIVKPRGNYTTRCTSLIGWLVSLISFVLEPLWFSNMGGRVNQRCCQFEPNFHTRYSGNQTRTISHIYSQIPPFLIHLTVSQ